MLALNKKLASSLSMALIIAISAGGVAFGIWNYGNIRYQAGLDKGVEKERAIWQKWYVEETTKANRRIEEIKVDASNQLRQANERVASTEARINKILNEMRFNKAKYDTVVYDRQARPIESTQVNEIYLGNDFSDTWNKLNREVK